MALVRSLKVLRFRFPVVTSPTSSSSSPSQALHVTPAWLVTYAGAELLGRRGVRAAVTGGGAGAGELSLQVSKRGVLGEGTGY